MLEFYPHLNINSGMLQDQTDNVLNTSLECGRPEFTIKCEKNYEICEGCGQKIHDRYYMRVGDTNWHEQCLSCSVCQTTLNYKCYVRNSKLYCKEDYFRMYGVKCFRCGEKINPDEMVMRVSPHFVFHLGCFVCWNCNQPLQKGEQFAFRSGQLICRMDLEKENFMVQQFDEDYIIEDHIRSRDGRRGPKRPRTILTSSQRRQFKASFEVSPKPCRKVREALAKDTGLSVRVVQVWFQNQRAKMKKVQRKSKGGDGDKGSDKDKDDKFKQESPGSDYIMDGNIGQPLNPNLPFSPEDYPAINSEDSMCSLDTSLDGSNFDHLDEASDSMSLQNLDLHNSSNLQLDHHGHHHNNNNNATSNLMTHIDKLYLMQNSYFNSQQAAEQQ